GPPRRHPCAASRLAARPLARLGEGGDVEVAEAHVAGVLVAQRPPEIGHGEHQRVVPGHCPAVVGAGPVARPAPAQAPGGVVARLQDAAAVEPGREPDRPLRRDAHLPRHLRYASPTRSPNRTPPTPAAPAATSMPR